MKETLEKWRETSGDPVNPNHYLIDGMDTFQYQEAIYSLYDSIYAPCVFNITKYVLRAPLKNGIEDIHKSYWYYNKMICMEQGLEGFIFVNRLSQEYNITEFITAVAKRYPIEQRMSVLSIYYSLILGYMDGVGSGIKELIKLIEENNK